LPESGKKWHTARGKHSSLMVLGPPRRDYLIKRKRGGCGRRDFANTALLPLLGGKSEEFQVSVRTDPGHPICQRKVLKRGGGSEGGGERGRRGRTAPCFLVLPRRWQVRVPRDMWRRRMGAVSLLVISGDCDT